MTDSDGMIAFEMAQQLTAVGETVAFLGMLDAFHPDYPRYRDEVGPFRRRLYGWYRTVEHHAEGLKLLPASKRRGYIRDKAHRASQEFGWGLADLFKAFCRKASVRLGRAAPAAMAPKVHPLRSAVSGYTPKPYGGPITIFRAIHQPLGIHHDRTLGWGAAAQGEIVIHDTPGFHAAIVVEPRVPFLVAKLRPLLEEIQQTQNDLAHTVP